jgi:ADP-ribose pyrophosphatase YjhB (NUDIX family)
VNFCSHCGHSVRLRWIEQDQRERFVCDGCGRIHYENPRVLVSCFAYWQDRLLMCRRAHAPAVGLWITPSGFVEKGETLEGAAVRETLEETGVRIAPDLLDLYSIASLPDISEIYVAFRVCLPVEPILVPGPESLDVALQTEAEIPWNDLAFRDALGDYPSHFFRHLRNGSFPIHKIQLRSDELLGSNVRVYKVTRIGEKDG